MAIKDDVAFIYNEFVTMVEVRDKQYPQFNNRNLVTYIDDSEMRMNSYTPDRESQGKADWQANFFHPVTRNKAKAIIAAASQQLPDTKIVARREGNTVDMKRAEYMKKLVKQSRGKNQELENFFSIWSACAHGTVIEYEGFAKQKKNLKFIKSYDPTTGEMEVEEREEIVKDECINVSVPLEQLFIKDIYLQDIQEQPALIWSNVLSHEQLEAEFGNYPKFSKIQAINQLDDNTRKTLFSPMWEKYAGENKYHVIKYFSRPTDRYVIVVNGVRLLDAPMIWYDGQDKRYPFAKSIFEPFAGKEFFYGNSQPNSMLGEQDVINSLYNMAVDKTYRSLVKPMLIGTVNQDAFDLEDEIITHDTKIAVEDVTQVKQMDIEGVNQSDLEMIKLVSQGLDLSSVDQVQQGVAGSGATAREIVIANENAKRLRTIFFMFLNDFWRQKTELRIINILIHYTSEDISASTGSPVRQILIDNADLPDGPKGFQRVSIYKNKTDLPKQGVLDATELAHQKDGVKMMDTAITIDYLKTAKYSVTIESNSLYRNDRAEKQAVFQEKSQIMATLFPQIFMQNQDVVFKDFANAYDEDPEKYQTQPPAPPPALAGPSPVQGQPAAGGQTPQPAPAAPGVNPAYAPIKNSLPALMDALAKKQ